MNIHPQQRRYEDLLDQYEKVLSRTKSDPADLKSPEASKSEIGETLFKEILKLEEKMELNESEKREYRQKHGVPA